MKSIYVHLSPKDLPFSNELNFSNFTFSSLPPYAEYSFKQTEYFLKNSPIILTNEHCNDLFLPEIKDFFNLCKSGFPSFYKDTFWLTTLLRLYIVFLYSSKNNIEEFIHLEYDNLIYSDFSNLTILPKSTYFTRVGPFCSSAGFVYCNSNKHFENFIDKLKSLLLKGEKTVQQFTRYDHLSEMIMIDLIYSHTKNVIDYLPILPAGTGDDNYKTLKVLFDGASYGQYLGGTNNGHSDGWYGLHQYVGQQLHNKNIKVFFDKKPYVNFNNENIPILNLHVHSKKLDRFTVI